MVVVSVCANIEMSKNIFVRIKQLDLRRSTGLPTAHGRSFLIILIKTA